MSMLLPYKSNTNNREPCNSHAILQLACNFFVNFFQHENGSQRERERELQQVYLSSFFNICFFHFFEKEIRQRKKKNEEKKLVQNFDSLPFQFSQCPTWCPTTKSLMFESSTCEPEAVFLVACNPSMN